MECQAVCRFNGNPSHQLGLLSDLASVSLQQSHWSQCLFNKTNAIAMSVRSTQQMLQCKCVRPFDKTNARKQVLHRPLIDHTAVIETFQLVRICISKALRSCDGWWYPSKNMIEHKIGSKVKVIFFGQKSLTPAPGQTMVGFQSSFTRKSLMKSGLKSRLIVPESDF